MAEAAGDVFGAIDAETGDTSEWTATDVETSNSFAADTDAEAHGTYGFKVLYGASSNDQCGAYKSVSDPTDFYCRCYIYIPSTFTGPAFNAGHFMELADGNYYTEAAEAGVKWDASGNPTQWHFRSDTALADITTATNFSTDAWHYVEIHWLQNATTGGWEVWVDGDSVGSEWNVDTSGLTVDRVYGGFFGYADDTAFIYVDDYKGDTSAIGVYAETGVTATIIPKVMYYNRKRRTT